MRVRATVTLLIVILATATASCTNVAQEAAKCDPECAAGTTCELQEVQCFTTPCNPIPTCVPADPVCTKECPANEACRFNWADKSQYCENPCIPVHCGPGYACQVEQVQCFQAPCPPVAVCEPVERALRTSNKN